MTKRLYWCHVDQPTPIVSSTTTAYNYAPSSHLAGGVDVVFASPLSGLAQQRPERLAHVNVRVPCHCLGVSGEQRVCKPGQHVKQASSCMSIQCTVETLLQVGNRKSYFRQTNTGVVYSRRSWGPRGIDPTHVPFRTRSSLQSFNSRP